MMIIEDVDLIAREREHMQTPGQELGFKKNLWLVAAAIAAHGVFDVVHHWLIANPGVPQWWPGFCLTFDVILGGWLAIRLVTRHARALN